MNNHAQKDTSHVDIAALSAGAVAVAVSLFVSPGAFTIVNLVVSIALITLIAAFVSFQGKGRLQRAAVAMVIGLAGIPGIGFLDESLRFPHPIEYLLAIEQWNCDQKIKGAPCNEKTDEPESNVQGRDLTAGWALISVIAYGIGSLPRRR